MSTLEAFSSVPFKTIFWEGTWNITLKSWAASRQYRDIAEGLGKYVVGEWGGSKSWWKMQSFPWALFQLLAAGLLATKCLIKNIRWPLGCEPGSIISWTWPRAKPFPSLDLFPHLPSENIGLESEKVNWFHHENMSTTWSIMQICEWLAIWEQKWQKSKLNNN